MEGRLLRLRPSGRAPARPALAGGAAQGPAGHRLPGRRDPHRPLRQRGNPDRLDGAPVRGEDESAKRLRQAACLLSDLGWAEHPDYRAEHAFLRILRMPFAGADHAERAFLATAIFVRYAGTLDSPALAPARGLLKEGPLQRAYILGLALRLGHTLTGGAALLLQRTGLRLGQEKLTLVLPEDAEMLLGDAVQRRVEALAKALNRGGEIKVQPGARLAG
ncbi:hypothetical protein [Aerophototrophica crusticola]|uniref:hypothetical protein n=1 Tax=Aerophototrophica crusticola TaxID=1709002 RepID=UPI00384EC151